MSIDDLVVEIRKTIKKNGLPPDNTGNWFSRKELDALRTVFESSGYETARLFQAGKIDPRDRPIEVKRNKTLLEVLELIHEKKLDPKSGGYLIGKLNQVLMALLEER